MMREILATLLILVLGVGWFSCYGPGELPESRTESGWMMPGDGTGISGVEIPVPENLKPENSAEGVSIAGIVGSLVSGSGRSGIVRWDTLLSVSTNGEKKTISHSLDVVPDIVYAQFFGSDMPQSASFLILGSSSAFKEKCGKFHINNSFTASTSGVNAYSSGGWPIDEADETAPIYNATETSISIGGEGMCKGTWVVVFIGGLD